MRTILHVDMNSYFATAEQQSNPFLQGKPLCVAGKGSGERTVCAALSIEAKKFGLKSGVSVWEAKAACPQIIIVQADYAKYQFISRAVFTILEQFTPLIEIFSIDEAFLDLTGLVNDIEEAKIVAQKIKQEISEKVGDYLKCSIGISFNKILAKLASEMQKPDGLTVIDKDNFEQILTQTPVEELCGIGPRLTRRLQNIGIKNIADMGFYPLEKLVNFFGPFYAKQMHFWGQGIDQAQVLPYYDMPKEKSYGHSYTLPKNIFKAADAKKVLLKLAEKVGRRMRKGKALGRTVCCYVRYFDFTGIMERTTLPRFINNGLEIYQTSLELMARNPILKPIRALGVSVDNLKRSTEVTQMLLPTDQRNERVMEAIDTINDRYGEFTLFRASLTEIKDKQSLTAKALKIENIPDGRNKRLM